MNLKELVQPHVGAKQIVFGEVNNLPAVFSYGPHYPIAIAGDNENEVWLNQDSYVFKDGSKSVTTATHRRLVERILHQAGYRPSAGRMNWVYSYTLWCKEIHSFSDLDIERQNAEAAG